VCFVAKRLKARGERLEVLREIEQQLDPLLPIAFA
jgi:hypothetical protein